MRGNQGKQEQNKETAVKGSSNRHNKVSEKYKERWERKPQEKTGDTSTACKKKPGLGCPKNPEEQKREQGREWHRKDSKQRHGENKPCERQPWE